MYIAALVALDDDIESITSTEGTRPDELCTFLYNSNPLTYSSHE